MCVSFRWLRVPTLPSLTWQKLCPASSLSNLYWWMVKLPTHTPTYSHAYTVCGKRYTVTFSPPYLAFSRNLLLLLFPVNLLARDSVSHAGEEELRNIFQQLLCVTLYTRRFEHTDGTEELCKFNIRSSFHILFRNFI